MSTLTHTGQPELGPALVDLLQWEHIEPDKDYTKKSRLLILHHAKENKFGFWHLFFKNIELGTTVALTGLLIFLILGGFSAWRVTSPLQVSNLDPTALKAEAQAIDIQIELANLNYNNSGIVAKSAESTPIAMPENNPKIQPSVEVTKEEAIKLPTATDNTSTTDTVSIDEALQKLSE